MIVQLAGYNVEADLLKNQSVISQDILTPEIFSSAYARISRSAKDVTALRYEAREDVAKARKSNQQIIFDMGHHSVAEHAVFNFDMIGVSRLALEEIEQFRLASYTEKSQRYVTLKGDYVIPEELEDDESKHLFRKTIELQNEFYEKAVSVLQQYIFNKYPDLAERKNNRSMLQGWAKEDARYILGLATEGQVGMTINARNLEHLFRRFRLSRHAEVRQIGRLMYDQVVKIAPSIILFSEPSQFCKDLKESFQNHFKPDSESIGSLFSCGQRFRLMNYTENADDLILSVFLALVHGLDAASAEKQIQTKSKNEKEAIYKDLFKHMEFFDSVPREFELVDFTFQAVISSSCYAQLKRHRMATLLPGSYDIQWGNVIPENIKITGLETDFKEIIEQTNAAYVKIRAKYGDAADYLLTNSHCRPVIMKMNLRELHHFIRLRDDDHAQWDIRNLAKTLMDNLPSRWPLCTLLLCGKSDFVRKFEAIYGHKPGFVI